MFKFVRKIGDLLNYLVTLIKKIFYCIKTKISHIKKYAFPLIIAIFALLPVLFSVLFYEQFKFYDFYTKTFSWLFYTFLNKEVVMGCLELSKSIYIRDISKEENSEEKIKKIKDKFDLLKRYLNLIISIIFVSVYFSVLSVDYVMKSGYLPPSSPAVGVITLEILLGLVISGLCFLFVKLIRKFVSEVNFTNE